MTKIKYLSGGQSAESVLRIGNTVHRSMGPNSERVHKLLKILEEKGFVHSPRFLGVEAGKEILSFIQGEIPTDNYVWTDERLIKVVRMLREFHDVTQGCALVKNNQVICHKDLAPWNTIIFDDEPVAFIDFDTAEPGQGVEDLAYMLWTFLDLGNATIPLESQLKRIALLCRTYGYTDGRELVENILKEQKRILILRESLAENSSNTKLKKFSQYAVVSIKEQIKWVERYRKEIESCL